MSRCPCCGRLADVEPPREEGDSADFYYADMHCGCAPEPFLVSRPRSDPSEEWALAEFAAESHPDERVVGWGVPV